MDHIMIPIRNSPFTMSQMMTAIKWMQKEFPNREIFMDGDEYAIVGRDRA